MNLRQIIEHHLPHSAYTNKKGWCSVVCRVCNDHGKKGPRAAFRWDGDTVGYNCFNCNHATKFDPSQDDKMPDKMIEVLRAYDIPDTDWLPLVDFNKSKSKSKDVLLEDITPSPIILPNHMYQLTDDQDCDVCQLSIEYLTQRGVNWQSQPFYLSTNKRWFGRLIIPIYFNNNLVSYLGRDLTGTRKEKYITAEAADTNVLYGYHNILERIDTPIYVCEGWFDAFSINGVAIFKSKMSDVHIKWLNKSKRPKVIIPDKIGGGDLANQAIKLGWQVSFPFLDTDVEDVNKGITKYGLLWVLKMIKQNTKSDFEAQLLTNMYCL